tara:strand:- start:95 stop:802 length:708 start_codon:yes stop_codon:yes gene_type:complete
MSKKVVRRMKRKNTRKRTKRKNTRNRTLRRTNKRTNRRTKRKKIIGGIVSPQPKLIRITKKRTIINAFGDKDKQVKAGKICLMLAISDKKGQILILFKGGDGEYKIAIVDSRSTVWLTQKTISAIKELTRFPDTLLKQHTQSREVVEYKYKDSELQKMYEYLKRLDTKEKYKEILTIETIQAEALEYIDNILNPYPVGEPVFTQLSSDPTKDLKQIKIEIMLERLEMGEEIVAHV